MAADRLFLAAQCRQREGRHHHERRHPAEEVERHGRRQVAQRAAHHPVARPAEIGEDEERVGQQRMRPHPAPRHRLAWFGSPHDGAECWGTARASNRRTALARTYLAQSDREEAPREGIMREASPVR